MGRPGDEAKRRRGWPGRPALSAPCANKPGLRFLGYIAAPSAPSTNPLRSPPYHQPAPGRAPVCTHTVGCTPNDIIVITHYLTSEATLQMILGSDSLKKRFSLRRCTDTTTTMTTTRKRFDHYRGDLLFRKRVRINVSI